MWSFKGFILLSVMLGRNNIEAINFFWQWKNIWNQTKTIYYFLDKYFESHTNLAPLIQITQAKMQMKYSKKAIYMKCPISVNHNMLPNRIFLSDIESLFLTLKHLHAVTMN